MQRAVLIGWTGEAGERGEWGRNRNESYRSLQCLSLLLQIPVAGFRGSAVPFYR